MGDHFRSKKLKSTFAIHHGAPVWILEEVGEDKIENETQDKDKLEELLHQLVMSDQPGLTLQWHDPESSMNGQGWGFHFPEVDESKDIPDKITVMTVQENEEEYSEVMSEPTIKYFKPNSKPVHYFQDLVTGHKYWDECDYEAYYQDCLLQNDGLSPQQLKEMYAMENPPK